MKKILSITICFIMILFLSGCKNTASMAVEKYLTKYNSLHNDVLTDMNSIVEAENLSEAAKKVYESIFEKQYTDLTYEIIEEEYNGDEATVEVQITVYDLYKVQNDASKYLAEHPEEFNDNNGKYDSQKFIDYKLEQMKNNTETVEYTLEFYVVKTAEGWEVSPLSNSDLEKIHGIYNYES